MKTMKSILRFSVILFALSAFDRGSLYPDCLRENYPESGHGGHITHHDC